MTAAALWAEFQQIAPIDVEYEAWNFGVGADGLAALVMSGVKTATASAYPLYEVDAEPIPVVGEYSVILDSKEEAVCIIRTSKVTVLPFSEVGADHAFREGEGDKSLAYWRAVHEAFFTDEMVAAGLVFTEAMPVVCEEFEVVYPK